MLPHSEVDRSPEDVEIDYKIRQDNKDKWNYLLVFNFEFNKTWSLQAEYGVFGGFRENVIVSGGFRW